ncbi:ubiquitin carboxyl-terminal hydrolase 36 [Asparagus officinalis]|uniref:ubiquitin carboxyl-terminal hydrolase 36 n=1 Tax=Asparagus officinalis TaxID=4686 RepID=UPI00098E1837|nr:ubiquitin carboxyl-terminal hydrolase 36 [Asparagus officinalis]
MDFAGPASTSAAKSGRKSDGGLDPVLGFKITFRRIGAGLQNLGNTCFLNSVLQCLTYTEPFAAYCHSGEHRSSCRTAGFCAMCALQNHVMNALQSTGKILSPSHLVKNLRCISRNFRNSRQEDAHEYMVNLLESMHKCCLPSGVPTESPSAYEKSLVHKIFGGRLRSQVRCLQCNYCSNKFDPFLDLSLEILKADSLTRALMHFTAKEQLDGGEKQYQCQRCKQKVRASKQLTVHKAPYVLTIHLKRFGPDVLGQKIDKKVGFEPSLDLKPFVSDPQEADLKYTLYGVLVHAGWSTHSGHYYCFVRTSSGMWHSLDDNQVRPVSEKTVLGQKAYMLFYVRDRSSAVKRSADFSQKENMLSSALGSKVICRPPFTNGAMQNSERNLSISTCSSTKFKTDDTSHGSTTQKESPTSQNNGQATVRQDTCLEANCEVSSDQLQLKDSVKLENPLTQMPPVTTSSQNKQATNESTHPSDSKDNGIITTSHSTGSSFTRESQQVAQEKSGLNSGCNRKVVLSVLAAQPTSNLLSQDGLHNDGTINAISQNNDNPCKMEIDRASANKKSKTVCKQLAGIKGNIKKEHFNEKSAAHQSIQKTVPEGDNCMSTQRTGKRLLETDECGLNTSIKMNVANGHLQQKAVAVEREKSAGDSSETKLQRKKPGRSLLNGQHFGRRKLFLTSLYVHKKKHKRSKKHRLNSKNTMKDLEDLHADDQGVSTSKATKVVDGASTGSSKKRPHSRVITENKVLGANNAEFFSGDFVHIRNLDESMKNDTNIDDQGVSMSESNKVFDVASADSSKRSSGSRSNKKENVEGLNSGKNCNAYFVHNRNSDRSSKFDIVLAASDQSTTPLNSTGHQCEGREADAYGKAPVQKGVVSLLTSLKEPTVPRWDDAELPSSQSHDLDNAHGSNIGYILDEWDEEYDRGRRKKVKKSTRTFGGPNPFQEIANIKLKQHNMQSKRYGNQPLRI